MKSLGIQFTILFLLVLSIGCTNPISNKELIKEETPNSLGEVKPGGKKISRATAIEIAKSTEVVKELLNKVDESWVDIENIGICKWPDNSSSFCRFDQSFKVSIYKGEKNENATEHILLTNVLISNEGNVLDYCQESPCNVKCQEVKCEKFKNISLNFNPITQGEFKIKGEEEPIPTGSIISREEAVNIAKSSDEVKGFLEGFEKNFWRYSDREYPYLYSQYFDNYTYSYVHTKFVDICTTGKPYWEIRFAITKRKFSKDQFGAGDPIEVMVSNDGEVMDICQLYCTKGQVGRGKLDVESRCDWYEETCLKRNITDLMDDKPLPGESKTFSLETGEIVDFEKLFESDRPGAVYKKPKINWTFFCSSNYTSDYWNAEEKDLMVIIYENEKIVRYSR